MENAGAGYRAVATVDFARIDQFLGSIVESIATHDMTVSEEGGLYRVLSPFGTASFEPLPGKLRLIVETTEESGLNRLKHALVGPILFIAAGEGLDIVWSGDATGVSLPDDLRFLHVAAVTQLTPGFRRITFRGADLARYDRADQLHCRLIFQPKGVTAPEWPMLDDRGLVVWPQDRKLPTRVYTIRRIDAKAGELDIDFSLHAHSGPATQWALEAAPGDIVGILGPAANGVKPAAFHVLAGDETGLPAIARTLESLGPDARGVAFIEIDGPAEEQALRCPAGIALHWLHRNGAPAGTTALLPDAVRSVTWPEDLGSAFFWGGCEYKSFRAIHRLLRQEVGLPAERQTLYSHWHRSLSEEDIIRIGAEAYLP